MKKLREGVLTFAQLICSELQTMITVVDSPSFFELYSSKDAIFNRPELAVEDG
jgi:hypothetical protein